MADESSLPANMPEKPSARKYILLSICILGGIFVLAMLLSPFKCRREDSRRVGCAMNMRSIATALLTYTDANKSESPVDWNILVKKGYLSAKQLRCPCADHPNYMYIRDAGSPTTREAGDIQLKNTRDFTTPIMFEPLENHGGKGGHILFLDSHVKWYSKDQYDKILAPYKDRAVKVEIEEN